MTRKPPTDLEHLRLFLDLARDQLELRRLYPTPPHVQLTASGERTQAYWNRLIRASSMRKFAIQESDNVYLTRLFDVLEKVVPQPPDDLADFLPDAREAFEKRSEDEAYIATFVDGKETSVPEMVEDLVYGELLHGDYGRHQRAVQRRWFALNDSALMAWLFAFEELLGDIVEHLETLEQRGALTLTAPDA